ncbi:hypothetical protein RRG08_017696 [Elysia crispata]|uniref:Uncharacterized protein n=1 Tax=Elysia crispata TaxID=231223 RepID=A0AAE0Z3K9_9GAST|nr:hypothetical protein RRG08_017696 [Elysia crispata]
MTSPGGNSACLPHPLSHLTLPMESRQHALWSLGTGIKRPGSIVANALRVYKGVVTYIFLIVGKSENALADYKVPARPGLRLGHSQGTIDKSNYAVMPYFTAQRTWMSDIRRIGPDKGHYSAKRHDCSEFCSASGLVYQ